mgnify:FL=1|tara:strand:- start:116 stop:547 length:432 start_codon:yes stop_codon:yes gene_type:complete
MGGTTFLAYQRELDPVISEAEAQSMMNYPDLDNLLWSKTYGGSERDMGYSVQVTSDGGYIIAGSTYSFGAGGEDVYLIKVQTPIPQPIPEPKPEPNIQIGPFTFPCSPGIAGMDCSFNFNNLTWAIIAIFIAMMDIALARRFI